MKKNPEIITFTIHQTENGSSVIEQPMSAFKRKNSLENHFFSSYGLSKQDKATLLTRSNIVYLDNKEGNEIGEIPYKQISEQANRCHTRPGVEIRLCYEIVR